MKPGWEVKPLGEVIELISGQHINAADYNRSEQGIGYLTGPSDFGDVHPIVSKWTEHPKRLAEKGDILLTVKGSGVGSINLLDVDEIAISRQIMAVRPKRVSPRYLFLLFGSLQSYFADRANGAAIPGISREDVLNYPLPIPPIEEQKRIVAVLDAAFEGLTRAKENAQANLQNARELVDQRKAATFEINKENWLTKTLADVCEKITDGTHQTPKYFDDGIIFLSSKNVTTGKIDWQNIKYIDEKQHIEMHKRVAPKAGDILLAKNGTTGVAAMVDRNVVFDIYVSLAHLRSRGEVSSEFLLHFVNSPIAKEQFNKRLKGTGVPNLHLKEIREVVISFPADLNEQYSIVSSLVADLKRLEALQAKYTRKLTDIADLRQSLLQQAFAGELT